MRNSNRQWRLKRRPEGDIRPGDLQFAETTKPGPGASKILVRNVYLSLDPTNSIRMSDMDQYMPPVDVGDVVTALGKQFTSGNTGKLLAQIGAEP
jgi:NADPH-dependent curcumin reductase CurA